MYRVFVDEAGTRHLLIHAGDDDNRWVRDFQDGGDLLETLDALADDPDAWRAWEPERFQDHYGDSNPRWTDEEAAALFADLEEVANPEADALALQIRESGEWDPQALERLCGLAGMGQAWEEAAPEDFEDVANQAADRLGVELW